MVTAVGVGVGDSRGRGRSGLVDTVRCQWASAPGWLSQPGADAER